MAPWPPKYGPPIEGAPDLPLNRSCLEPIRATFPGGIPTVPALSEATLRENAAVEKYQRDRFFTFTTQDLVDLDVLTDATLLQSTLRRDRPVHPLFHSNRWEVSPSPDHPRMDLYPLPNRPGLYGDWVYSNLLVREAIMPALRIATQVMESAYMLPWFASLFNYPEFTDIPIDRIYKDDLRRDPNIVGRLKNFVPAGAMNAQTLENARLRFEEFVGRLTIKHNYQLGFAKALFDPMEGSRSYQLPPMAFTMRDYRDNIFTFITCDYIEHLLRPDLTDCERMGLEWSFANTLVHEVCHALYMAVLLHYNRDNPYEPYFEQQPVTEIGFAMEQCVFGGIGDAMMGNYDELSIGTWLALQNTCVDIADRAIDPILINPPLLLTQTLFPIKASFFQDVQQDDFWLACIGIYGWPALHARNMRQGASIKFKSSLLPQNQISKINGPEQVSIVQKFKSDRRIPDLKIALREYARQNAGQMTGVQRQNIRIGIRIITESVYEGDFWLRTVQMREFLEIIGNSVEYVAQGKTKAERWLAVDEICIFLKSAEEIHRLAIRAFRTLNRSLQRQDRLDDLLSFNRGARIYAKGCFDLISNDTTYMDTATVIQRRYDFEYCRMMLFAPEDTTGIIGYDELPTILAIERNARKGRLDICKEDLEELSSAAEGSIYVEAVGLVLESAVIFADFAARGSSMDLPALNNAYSATSRALATFTQLRDMCVELDPNDKDTIRKWVATLETWIARANSHLNACREAATRLSAVPGA